MIKDLKGHILAVLTVLIWSTTFIVSKLLLEQFTPLQILLIRFAMAIIFLSILYPKFKKPTSFKEEFLFLLTSATLVGYFIFENSALKHTYSSNVSLIVSTIPLITGVLSAVLFKTHFFNKKSLLGFAIAYSGVALIIINGNQLVGIEPIGDFFALLASIMFALYSIAMQRIDKTYHLIEMTRKIFIYGVMILAILNLIVRDKIQVQEITPPLVISFLFLGIVAASLAFLMWNRAIHIIGSVKTNQYIYLVPVITTLLSAIIIHEKITAITIVGALLIIGGLYLSEKLPSSESKAVIS
ncbi:MAG: DMT family transporter [Vallitaleaceae bacterium]|nr:DMT family transporter [Vallitaleaceae bacterium]